MHSLSETATRTREFLLAQRTGAGWWEGELSSSALSTATALFALALHDREIGENKHAALIGGGISWLIRAQNPDGGWGDTTLSRSNISTTVLCWAALSVAGSEAAEAARRAEAWIAGAAGSTEPETLSRAIADRYGKDRTFSVPILTMSALAGRLGKDGWRLIPALPFELAACPPQWFQWLQLPVVSYALPALIAIGQVIHHHRPSLNPIRSAARGRTLEVLRGIQPEGGGFLEATPLTSFVTMSLLGCGQARHPVVRASVEFLKRSVRPDGSWPIDTNLATWVTTLSVNALAGPEGLQEAEMVTAERVRIRNWLLGQQYRQVHPYTQAAPGGWAWTDLPGGVPDADDTAGALIALHNLAIYSREGWDATKAGVTWLLDLQNHDGGMPTFCRGWGALPFDRSGADLTAHALHAWSSWRPRFPRLAPRLERATTAALAYLQRTQREDGAWIPLWFGNEHVSDETNPTYGTARTVRALAELADRPEVKPMIREGVDWLTRVQNPDGGWGGGGRAPSSIEETGLALQALAHAAPENREALERGAKRLVELTDGGRTFDPAPIGFYFARLWYYEQLYPAIMAAGAFTALREKAGFPSP